ncbi:hypothetical protein ACFXAZ_20530 [Streptomyces sp. NPDC059477]|uniref:hypothetical protein n=1 Tax=Streptomyces sp. NPDC059477 TaxID=3346847 RepID=UPI00368C2C37
MVSSAHDAMHRIFRREPGLFSRLLPRAGITFPEYYSIDPLDTDLTEIKPIERRVDSLFQVRAADDEGGFLLAVESQSKPDPDKRNSWTYYLAYLYAKYRLPPILLVLCRDKTTAAWAMEPIRIGRRFHTSMHVFPLVLGPGNLSVITDPDQAAQDLPVAVFSAFAHAKDPGLPAILEALSDGMKARSEADTETDDGIGVGDWAEYVEIGLGDSPARYLWRQLVKAWSPQFPGSGTVMEETWLAVREKGEAEGLAKGLAKGRAEAILRVLYVRDVEVSDDIRQRITECTDVDVLGVWFDRSVSVTNAEELFAEAEADAQS